MGVGSGAGGKKGWGIKKKERNEKGLWGSGLLEVYSSSNCALGFFVFLMKDDFFTNSVKKCN